MREPQQASHRQYLLQHGLLLLKLSLQVACASEQGRHHLGDQLRVLRTALQLELGKLVGEGTHRLLLLHGSAHLVRKRGAWTRAA